MLTGFSLRSSHPRVVEAAVNGRAKPTVRTWRWSHRRGKQPSVAPATRKKLVRPVDRTRLVGDPELVTLTLRDPDLADLVAASSVSSSCVRRLRGEFYYIKICAYSTCTARHQDSYKGQ